MKPLLISSILLSASLLLTSLDSTATDPKLSAKALATLVYDKAGNELTLGKMLSQFENTTIFVDLWASWCKDCIVGFPKVEEFKEKYNNITFVYLSVDKEEDAWQKGIERFNLKDNNYRVSKGWESEFCESIDLDWIPRYMILDSDGNIIHFRSVEADERSLKKTLRTI